MPTTTADVIYMIKYSKSGHIDSEHDTVAQDKQKRLLKGINLVLLIIMVVRTMTVGTKGTVRPRFLGSRHDRKNHYKAQIHNF